MGLSLPLLHPFPCCDEGTGCFPRLATLEGTISAICRLVRLHWIYHHHFSCWFPRLPQGQLEHIKLCRLIRRHSNFHPSNRGLEALAQDQGEFIEDSFRVLPKHLLIHLLQFQRAATIDLWSGRLQDGEIMPHKNPRNTWWGRFIDWLM